MGERSCDTFSFQPAETLFIAFISYGNAESAFSIAKIQNFVNFSFSFYYKIAAGNSGVNNSRIDENGNIIGSDKDKNYTIICAGSI